MADDLLERYVRRLIEAHEGSPVVTVAWQGGEPTLMGLDFFRRAAELVERHLRPGQRAEHTIQTDGTLLDAEWAAFLREHRVLVGISIDGPREVHDAYRVTKDGRGSFDAVMRGLAHLRDGGVEWNALTTVHAANSGRGREVYRFLRDECGARFVQFIPIVERVAGERGDRVSGRSVTADGYGRFLIDVFEEWVRRDVGTVYVRMFDVALADWAGERPGLCVHSETCGMALAMEHTGDLYCCDHFVEPAYLLGNIRDTHMRDLVASERQRRFGLDERDRLPRQCRECDVRFACRGGCPKDRLDTTADGEPGLNHLCAGYMAFFRHVDPAMRFMASRLRGCGAPADVMRAYAADDARRGRNSPCSCGSGRKRKRCHAGS